MGKTKLTIKTSNYMFYLGFIKFLGFIIDNNRFFPTKKTKKNGISSIICNYIRQNVCLLIFFLYVYPET